MASLRPFDGRRLALTVDVTLSVDIREACEDALSLATMLGVIICFDFNGKKISIMKGMSIEQGVEQYSSPGLPKDE